MHKIKLAHILFVVAGVIMFLLLPGSITTPSQYGKTMFVVGLGIDKDESSGIELSAQVVAAKPNAAASESYQIVSSSGVDLIDAVENMRREVGKLLGLSHCYVVVVSDELCDEYNLATLFDPLVRTERIGTNVILVHTFGKAQDLLLACEEIGGDAQNVLENLTKYNHEYILNKDASLYDFYKDYLSPHSTGMIVTIDQQEQTQDSASSSSNQTSQNSDQSQTQSNNTLPQKEIVNRGIGVAFYQGKKVANIDQTIIRGLGWLDCTSKFNNVKLEHINTNKLKDATVTLNQKGCKVKYKASINNNTPTLYVDLEVQAKIVGIKCDQTITISDLASYFDDAFMPVLQDLVTKETDIASEFQRQHKLDILNYYKIFNTQIHNEWQNYLKTLDDPTEYANNIQVFVKTTLKQTN